MRFSIQTHGCHPSDGSYCVTLSTHGQRKLLTSENPFALKGGLPVPTSIGSAVIAAWQALPQHFSHLATDAFYLMPDGICGLVSVGAGGTASLRLLYRAVSAFKAETTRVYNLGSAQDYHSRLWQTAFRCDAIVAPAELDALRQRMFAQGAYPVRRRLNNSQ